MVVRMRHTRSHTGNRRSHHKVRSLSISTDSKTGVVHLRHRASLSGMYRGRTVADPVAKLERAKKRVAKKKT